MNNAVMIIQAPRHQRDAVLASEIERLDPFQKFADRTSDMREEYSPTYDYADDLRSCLADSLEWCERPLCDYFFPQPLPGRAY